MILGFIIISCAKFAIQIKKHNLKDASCEFKLYIMNVDLNQKLIP